MTKLQHSKIYRPYHVPQFGPHGTPDSGSITVGKAKKGKTECLTISFAVGSGRKWHIELAVPANDFDEIASAMMKLDKERTLRAFAKALLE